MPARSLASKPTRLVALLGSSAVVVATALTFAAPSADAARAAAIGATDWAAYEHGPAHSSAAFNDTAITTANVASLHALWSFKAAAATKAGQPGPKFDASPSVAGGIVYIGARTGVLYALNASTGAVVWKKSLDFGSPSVCAAKGIVGTATVAADPVSGALTVYAPGSHYLYALDAANGTQRWKVAIGPATADGEARWFNWSSPTVVGGKIYMGLAASCDANKIRGGVVQVDQHTGAKTHTWYAVPAGKVGPSVWSSMAGDGTSVWVTTGNPDPSAGQVYDAFSVVRLSASTLAKQEKWTVPTPITDDLDFGSSPTFFSATLGGTATDMIGACNKNGVYYAWRRANLAAGPVWQRQVGQTGGTGNGACITSAAYDGPNATLFVAANQTTIGGTAAQGSVRALNPATGAVVWEKPLGCLPNGSPTLNATTHVLAVPLYGCTGTAKPGVALFNATTGAPLRTITATAAVFAQPVFAEGRLFVADESGTLTVYGP
ncbi:MAG: outer membrane protein assembly factor BamB family protein [Actinomycetes bacterium]